MQLTEIRPVETAEEAVEQGAQLLDKYRPGWAKTVHGAMTAHLFSMENWSTCMVGTLELFEGGVADGHSMTYISFNGLSFQAGTDESKYVGFLPLDEYDDDAFDELDELWRAQVRQRVAP